MNDLEQHLRTRLHGAVAHETAPNLGPEVQQRVVRLRRRATTARATGAVAGVIVLVAAVLTVGRSGDDVETAAPAAGQDPRVESLPNAPIDARFQHAAVWTGTEVIEWGGCGNDGAVLGDGAAYNPSTKTWRKLAASPLDGRCAPLAVWTGSEAVVVGGGGDSASPGTTAAAYDPATDQWRPIAHLDAGFANSSISTIVWTGKEVVVAGIATPGDQDGATALAFAYNPRTDSWRRLADAPADLPLFGDAVWTGGQMLIVGTARESGKTRPVWQVLALDPAAGSWRVVPNPPLDVRGTPAVAWTGQELVVGGGKVADAWATDAAAYDPAAGSWRPLPGAPVGFAGASRSAEPVVGGRVVVLSTATDDPGTRPLVLDAAAGTWTVGPSLGWPATHGAHDLPPVSDVTIVSTGDSVIVWGGGVSERYEGPAIGCCRPLGEGVQLTP